MMWKRDPFDVMAFVFVGAIVLVTSVGAILVCVLMLKYLIDQVFP